VSVKDDLVLQPPDVGVLFVVSGPSGVGKSTLIGALMRDVPGVAFSVSATTRAPRPGEADGADYHFLSATAFQEGVERGDFLEHAEVYGKRYGTLAAPVNEALAAGRSLLLDIDVQGARQVRARMSEAVHIFILPPDRATVEGRLRRRGTDDETVIQRRLVEMDEQLAAVADYDYLIVNDHLPTAMATLQGVVLAEMVRRSRRNTLVQRWLSAVAPG
jgi:guanylate kinase